MLAEVGETETASGGGAVAVGAVVSEPQRAAVVVARSATAVVRGRVRGGVAVPRCSLGRAAKWFSNPIPSSWEQAINCEFILGADIHLSVNDSRHDEFHRLAGLISREILIAVVQFAAQVRRVKCSQNSRLTSAV